MDNKARTLELKLVFHPNVKLLFLYHYHFLGNLHNKMIFKNEITKEQYLIKIYIEIHVYLSILGVKQSKS